MVRIASATGVPWATSTSTWRSLATLSSGVCLFLDMDPSSFGSEAILQGGPLQRGRISGREAMLFRQLFDQTSGTYTYLFASRRGGEALIIDPVLEKVDRYLQLIRELDLKLVKAVDTHLHADHITGLGALRDRTQCITVMGERSEVDVCRVDARQRGGQALGRRCGI